jgi:hypothetical protein
MTTHTGSCQCGAVRFEVDGDFTTGMTCNCSRCGRVGYILAFVPASQFRLVSGEENLTEYRFHKKEIAHLFCKTCGVQSFGRGTGPDGTETVAVNLRCVDGIDPKSLQITEYNGKDI